MGNILNAVKTCGSGYPEIEEDLLIFLDFEGLNMGTESDTEGMEVDEPTGSSLEQLENQLLRFHFSAERVLRFMQDYNRTGRKNVLLSQDDVEVLDSLHYRIFEIQRALLLSSEIERLVPKLLDLLLSSNKNLRDNSEYFLQLGRIMDIAIQYDELKIAAPGLQNDISYVKRQLILREDFNTVFGDLNFSDLSLFYIKPAPLFQALILASTNFFMDPQQRKPLDVIVSFCKICIGILSTNMRSKFQKAGTVGLVQRVMVATALLYDHLSERGLFVKDSPLSIKQIVHILQLESGIPIRRHGSFGSRDRGLDSKIHTVDRTSAKDVKVQAQNLLNVLKYTNKHLKDDSTPKSVKAMFESIV